MDKVLISLIESRARQRAARRGRHDARAAGHRSGHNEPDTSDGQQTRAASVRRLITTDSVVTQGMSPKPYRYSAHMALGTSSPAGGSAEGSAAQRFGEALDGSTRRAGFRYPGHELRSPLTTPRSGCGAPVPNLAPRATGTLDSQRP